MICYRDRTYCGFWATCKNSGDCYRCLTDDVKMWAEQSGLPLCQFAEHPDCYELDGEVEYEESN
jgi:hypothetical protein